MATLIGTEHCPNIRALIDISLSEGALPDSTIKLDLYSGRAEDWVLEQDANALLYLPGAAQENATKAKRVQRAAQLYCAALLCPVIPNITRDDFEGNEGYTRKPMDYDARAQQLMAEANEEMLKLTETTPLDVTAVMPTMFTVAPGYRGR